MITRYTINLCKRVEGLLNKALLFFTTAVQKLNHGTHPESGRNWFRGCFFVTFLQKQKSKRKKWSGIIVV